jgi:hypothetical protein
LIACIGFCGVVVIIFPLENLVLRHVFLILVGGRTVAVWPLIFLQLLSYSILGMGFSKSSLVCLGFRCLLRLFTHLSGAMTMYLSSATPSRRSLGAVIGLGRAAGSVQSAVGPAAADSLFAFSITNNLLGGNLAYVVMLTLVCVGFCIAVQLPRHVWTHRKR